ncbi:MAG: dTDP-4-dehydrorhamnose reductase [Pseudomonadota bacterium]
MKILLTGATGQVGYELERSLQGLGQVVAVDRARMDLADLDQVRRVIREVQPQLIVNPAAYTAVDKAESEPALALRINGEAPGVMAEEAKRLGAAMVHYSTDYVFDGTKSGAYVETDPTCPINVYGQSKLAGEQAIAAAGIDHLILRTSWVYGMHGKNFLLTMLRLGAEREEVRVVADQFGAPTWSRTIADATALILAQARAGGDAWWERNGGMYHLCSGGQTSWCGFAAAIMAQAQLACRTTPIPASDYPVPARRPANSVMDTGRLRSRFGELPDWQVGLRLCVER